MSSIRSKITLLTVCEVIVAVTIVTLLAVIATNRMGRETANQMLELQCESGQKNLDAYFQGVESAVEMVSSYAESDLSRSDLSNLADHLDRVSEIFAKTARNTAGVLTYYYRIDPTVSSSSGFWYVYSGRYGFTPHEVTDITQYDADDQNSIIWYKVPKAMQQAVWLPPYVTDNLNAYVLSYNVPIYKGGTFVGVIGIEIDYSTLSQVADRITLYKSGYAFVTDAEGNLVYHPHIDVPQLDDQHKPSAPAEFKSDDKFVRYTYDGVEKQATRLPLSNGMRINVTVPVAEVDENWHTLVNQITAVSLVLLAAFALLTWRFVRRITNPLQELTAAAKQLEGGNYDVELSYEGNDEVGILTHTVRSLVSHLKAHVEELSSLAYADALTHVHNKGAYNIMLKDIQAEIDDEGQQTEFAIGIFDCDYLKQINDEYGHDKGDVYLTCACELICQVFAHSPVFRIGGDEFAVILRGDDFQNRDELVREFERRRVERCAGTDVRWEQVSVSKGIAAFDRAEDKNADDVARRADKLMYQEKWQKRAAR